MGMWDMLTQNQNDIFLRNKEEADAKAALEKELLLQTIMSKKDFNPEAQVGFWDKLKPWDTANERADALNRQAMALQPGGTEQLANEYYDAEGMTSGAKWADKNFNWTPTTQAEISQTVNDAKQSLGNIGSNISDLGQKYFGGAIAAKPAPSVPFAPNALTAQQTELGNNLPSSLKQPDNISSFWEYLKNNK